MLYAIAVAEAAERVDDAMNAAASLEPFAGDDSDAQALKTFETARSEALERFGGASKSIEVARATAEKAVAALRIQWAKAAVSEKRHEVRAAVAAGVAGEENTAREELEALKLQYGRLAGIRTRRPKRFDIGGPEESGASIAPDLCIEDGCAAVAHYGHEDDGERIHCAEHREEGEVKHPRHMRTYLPRSSGKHSRVVKPRPAPEPEPEPEEEGKETAAGDVAAVARGVRFAPGDDEVFSLPALVREDEEESAGQHSQEQEQASAAEITAEEKQQEEQEEEQEEEEQEQQQEEE